MRRATLLQYAGDGLMIWKPAFLLIVVLAGCQGMGTGSNAIDPQPGMTPQLAASAGNPYLPTQ
jgi:hypothetical protein